MTHIPVISVAVFFASAVFYMLGRHRRRYGDEQAAGAYYSIFFILFIALIALVVLYLYLSSHNQDLLFDNSPE